MWRNSKYIFMLISLTQYRIFALISALTVLGIKSKYMYFLYSYRSTENKLICYYKLLSFLLWIVPF